MYNCTSYIVVNAEVVNAEVVNIYSYHYTCALAAHVIQ